MVYNKTSEERKWNYWKEQEEKKLRELGMEEEKIQKLRQMDREDFLEERRYREHLDETMQDMDSIKEKDSELFARDVKELLDHIGDKRIYELLKETEHQTLEILLLSTWGYSGREVAKIMGMAEQTIYTKRNRLRKKLKNLSKIIYVFLTIFLYLPKCPQSLILSALRAFCFCGKPRISRSIFLYFPCQSWLKSW